MLPGLTYDAKIGVSPSTFERISDVVIIMYNRFAAQPHVHWSANPDISALLTIYRTIYGVDTPKRGRTHSVGKINILDRKFK